MLGLQILGLSVVLATMLISFVSFWLWKKLPDNKKVWSIGLIIGWCGLLTFAADLFGPY